MSFQDYKSFIDYIKNHLENVPFVIRSEGIEYSATITNEGILYSIYDSKDFYKQSHKEIERLFNQYFETAYEISEEFDDVDKTLSFILPIIKRYIESTRPNPVLIKMRKRDKQKEPLGIDELYYIINEDLDSLSRYLHRIESLINERIKIEKDEKLNQGEYRADLWIIDASWGWEIGNYLYVSFLFLLFAVFENTIDNICDEIAIKRRQNIRRKDLTGGLINSSKKYLEDFGKFKQPNNEQWNAIRGIYDVRNICIHGGGDSEKAKIGSKKRINNLIKMDIGLREEWESTSLINVGVTSSFCKYAISHFRDFFSSLEEEHRAFSEINVV